MKQLPAEIAVGGTRTAGCDIEIMTHEKVPCIMKEQENMSISEKLNILADAAKYDVSCSSSGVERRGDGRGDREFFQSRDLPQLWGRRKVYLAFEDPVYQ